MKKIGLVDETCQSSSDKAFLWPYISHKLFQNNLVKDKIKVNVITEVLLSITTEGLHKNIVCLLDISMLQLILCKDLTNEDTKLSQKISVK